ncbi:hypothetical protein C8R42DRAFT_642547 [Lentinula raphanica]|nr:hypothetical protein C8R42DRAFT_642547 [Lentinula raphanica]
MNAVHWGVFDSNPNPTIDLPAEQLSLVEELFCDAEKIWRSTYIQDRLVRELDLTTASRFNQYTLFCAMWNFYKPAAFPEGKDVYTKVANMLAKNGELEIATTWYNKYMFDRELKQRVAYQSQAELNRLVDDVLQEVYGGNQSH